MKGLVGRAFQSISLIIRTLSSTLVTQWVPAVEKRDEVGPRESVWSARVSTEREIERVVSRTSSSVARCGTREKLARSKVKGEESEVKR